MLVLVLDSSTPAVTAALAEITADAVLLRAQRSVVDARAHGELLAPQVAEVLAETGAKPTDLAAVVVGLGPGPFTGLRVGLVTAASMGQVLGIPTYGVGSLDAIGYAATHPRSDAAPEIGPVLAATDARRREIYWAVYDLTGERLVGPSVDAPAVVAERARELAVRVAVGEGAQRYADILALSPRAGLDYPPPYALAELAADRVRAGAPGDQLTPLYLRRPDAVAAASRKPVLQ
ncbi:tRNA (adenosine(37)-N6)-threonylcarbamoyltransferase complex dimerization subunit type 1 TsaB [Plantactinospora solaniradicis]|uniref:tRNA (Adenosine(37)-N6)-threonylcarbamoyltransferase complex dimerization subunit type 1 TsaB n=1 Tax=Plantactinospora solaniradicis TaxID=1723736 RepID=A0ABW1KEY7_9ACTN